SDELRFFMDLTISDNRLIGSSEEELEERYKHLDISEWIDKYNSGNYLTFTDSIWKERNLIEQALREMQAVTGYDAYLRQIEENATLMSTISIFAKPGTFAYRNIQQTPDDFAHLKGNELQFDVSKGVTMATQFMATDVIAVLMIFVVIVLLITREKEQRCLGLIKTTYKGRGPLVASKLLAV